VTCSEVFSTVLNEQGITTVFQPIVSLQDGAVFGYEALSRITLPSCTLTIEELFTIASQKKKLWELEKLCRSKAFENAFTKPANAKLFLNVDANVMQDPELKSGFTCQKLREYGMDPQDIIIEVTEKNAVKAMETFTASIQHYRSQQYKIAIDDFGSGYSGLNRVCTFSPEFLKIDMELVRGIDQDPIKKSAVSATIGFCKESGIEVIAEGIETEEELKTLIRLGADYGQGYYLARPAMEFRALGCEQREKIQSFHHSSKARCQPSVFGRVSAICSPQHTVSLASPSLIIYEMMRNDPQVTECFVLNEHSCVCGILTRSYILEKFGGEYGYNLSRRLTVEQIMGREFLAMEANMSIEEVASLAMSREISQIYDAIAVTEHGKYVGTVSVKDLLLTAVKMQVRRAKDESPLTGLPGNTIIQEVIKNTYASESPWAIVYLDLDYFKAYNDAYGFTSGDLMIKALSNAMQECSERQDFIGHIGGDDFVLIRNDYDKLYELCQRIGETFRKHINPLYSREDWERGYILSNNRNGFQQNFPIVTISIAVVSNRSQRPSTMEELSKIIAETKKKAKQIEGNSIIIV